MHVISLPPPLSPRVTVKSLAEIMMLPAFDQERALRDQKYPRSDKGKNRVPYYQPANQALKSYVECLDVRVIELAIDEQEAKRIAAVEGDDDPPAQRVTRIEHNLRVLAALSTFPRLREVTGGRRGLTRETLVAGVSVRSTPELHVIIDGEMRHVFVECAEEVNEDEARRTLELAHWLEREVGDADASIKNFEYWLLAEGRALSVRSSRKSTVDRALRTLPILASAWDQIAPPKARQARQAANDGG
ncbi:MAG: hypothetical protein WC538_21045 [Thermoanaerobaculia bacterium]|jgi:hypothetical protein